MVRLRCGFKSHRPPQLISSHNVHLSRAGARLGMTPLTEPCGFGAPGNVGLCPEEPASCKAPTMNRSGTNFTDRSTVMFQKAFAGLPLYVVEIAWRALPACPVPESSAFDSS